MITSETKNLFPRSISPYNCLLFAAFLSEASKRACTMSAAAELDRLSMQIEEIGDERAKEEADAEEKRHRKG